MIIKSILQAYYRFWYRFLKIQKKVCGSKSITEKWFKGFKTLKTKCFNQNLSDLLKKLLYWNIREEINFLNKDNF